MLKVYLYTSLISSGIRGCALGQKKLLIIMLLPNKLICIIEKQEIIY